MDFLVPFSGRSHHYIELEITAAVDAMRRALNALDIDGTVVIGEGERDEAPMLFIGENVGSGYGSKVDIALDPLEGTTITAKGGPNALAVLALAAEGCFLNSPDVYMEKLVQPGVIGIAPLCELEHLLESSVSVKHSKVVPRAGRPRAPPRGTPAARRPAPSDRGATASPRRPRSAA